MSRPLINAIVSLFIFLVMTYQVWRTPAHTYKRHSYIAAALAFVLLALFNGKVALHGDSGTWTLIILWLAFLLLLVSFVLLFLAWRAGEMQVQIERARQALEHERERREGTNEKEENRPEDAEK